MPETPNAEVLDDEAVDPELEMFWMTQLVNCLVERLGGEIVVTEEEMKGMLDYDSSWRRWGDLYCIKVKKGS